MSTTQQDIVSDPTNLTIQGSPVANKAYERTDNIIAFDARSTADSPAPIGDVSHGLAKMGYNVLVVNSHDEYPDYGRTKPMEVPLPKGYPGTIHAWSHQKDGQKFGDCLDYFSNTFDYVLVDASSTSMQDRKALSELLVRLIISQYESRRGWLASPEVAERTFMVTCQSRPPMLYMNDLGAPEGIVKEAYGSKNAVPRGLEIPLIASCHPGVDQVELARAILGSGDPLRIFTTKKNAKGKMALYHYAYLDKEWVAGGVLTVPTTSIFAVISMNELLLSPMPDSLMVGLISSIVALTSVGLGAIPTLRHRFRKGHFNSRFAKVKDIYTRHDEDNLPITAPAIRDSPIRSTPEDFAPIVSTSWQKAEQRYLSIKTQWVEYELDVFKTLEAPLMVDYSCSETQALAQAMQHAEQAMVEAQEGVAGSTAIYLRQNFTEKVNTLEIAFKIAEDNALRKGLSYLENSEQSKVQQARQLLMLAQDAGASDSEREVSYIQAMKNLQGIIVVSSKTQQSVLESSGLRKEIVQ